LVAPRIHANVFANDQDVAEMLDAVKFLRKIAAAGPMAKFIKQELRPGPMVTSDANLIADFRERSGTVYHPACSCRMGPDAASAVIDARLRVHGVGGLRVVDASSFPNQISGNLNGPTMMLAWKAAQIMLEDHAAL
jgi:choline dehydrogenase